MNNRSADAGAPPVPGPSTDAGWSGRWFLWVKVGLLLTISAAVWFAGPYLAIGGQYPMYTVESRLAAVALLLGLFALPVLTRRLAARRRVVVLLLLLSSIALGAIAAAYLVHGFYTSTGRLGQIEWFLVRDADHGDVPSSFDDKRLGETLLHVLPQLDALAELQRAAEESGRDVPGIGVSHFDRVEASVQAAYRRGIETLLQPLLLRRVEQQLDGGYPDDFLYEALKVYLMLNRPEHRDAEFMANWVILSFEREMVHVDRSTLDAHVRALADMAAGIAVDASRVDRVRTRLRQAPLSVRVYSGIRAEIGRSRPPWRLSERVPARDLAYFARVSGQSLSDGIPGLYTADGYQVFHEKKLSILERQLRENWVLGDTGADSDSISQEALDRDLEATYARDFIRHWQALLDDLQVAPIGSLAELAVTVDAFVAPESSLTRVLRAVTAQTRLAADRHDKNSVSANPSALMQIKRISVADGHGQAVVRQHFRSLNSLFEPEAGEPAPIDAAISSLAELKRFIDAMSFAADVDDEMFDSLLKHRKGRDIMRRVANIAARQPAPLKYWLQSVSRFDFLQAAALADTRTMQAINAAWQSTVLPVCAAALDDRYPVAASSSQDVALADFSTLFAPGGLLDEFWQQHLEPYVDTSGIPWRLKRQTGLPLADSSLAFFERVAVIRSAMFSGRERTPRLNMQVKPVSLSADTTMVRLVNGSQDLVYRHGPQMVTNFSWPPAGENQAQIDFSRLSDPDRASSIVKRGPWALFRLFDRANTEVSNSQRGMRVTFAHAGSEASFLVGAGTKAAFPTGLLEGLQCPESL